MKIIQLIYSLCSGGAERFVVSLSNQLAAMGHDVTVCMLLSDENQEYLFNRQYLNDNVTFVSLNLETGFSFRKVRQVEKYITSSNPDVVHCHLNVIPYIYRLSLQSKNIKFIHTLHSVAEYTSGNKYQKFINRCFYSKEKIVPVTISDKCYNSYKAYYGLSNAVCIINGCMAPVKTENYESVHSEVESYKANYDTPVFIHVARCHPAKNQQLLIESFNELNRRNIDFVLLVVGDGFEKDRKDLVDMACDKIHFVGLKNNVADYLFCSDAFCLTSTYEGMPISLIEALSCAVVPVCTMAGGIPDVIEDGVSGLLADDMTVDAYTRKLQCFITEPDMVSADKLRELYDNNYSIKSCAERYIEIYSA